MQSDVGVAGQALTERRQPFHERSGNSRVWLLHDGRIDVGRAAYLREWMALALEEAQKIDHQRRGKRCLPHHRLECTVKTES